LRCSASRLRSFSVSTAFRSRSAAPSFSHAAHRLGRARVGGAPLAGLLERGLVLGAAAAQLRGVSCCSRRGPVRSVASSVRSAASSGARAWPFSSESIADCVCSRSKRKGRLEGGGGGATLPRTATIHVVASTSSVAAAASRAYATSSASSCRVRAAMRTPRAPSRRNTRRLRRTSGSPSPAHHLGEHGQRRGAGVRDGHVRGEGVRVARATATPPPVPPPLSSPPLSSSPLSSSPLSSPSPSSSFFLRATKPGDQGVPAHV